MRRKSFTLVELLIILSVSAILISISIPGWVTITRRFRILSTLEAAAMNVSMALTEARAWSVSRQDEHSNVRPVEVSFENNRMTYEIVCNGDCNLVPEPASKSFDLPEGVVAQWTVPANYFYVLGFWANQVGQNPYQIQPSATLELSFGGESRRIQIQNGLPVVME